MFRSRTYIDVVISHETEASRLVGFEVNSVETPTQVASILHDQGAKAAIIKLGIQE